MFIFTSPRFLLFFFSVFFLLAYHAHSEEDKPIDGDTTTATYRITNTEYIIKGWVTTAALALQLELPKTAVFDSFEKFDSFLRDRKARISNLRQLKTSSTIIYHSMWNEDEKLFDVVLSVYANTDWTLFILPYFRYSDSSGFLLGARARDYNFLGSLETLSIDFDYNTDPNFTTELGGAINFKYPFHINSHIFTLGIHETISWKNDSRFENRVGLSFAYTYPLNNNILLLASVNQDFVTEGNITQEINVHTFSESTFDAGVKINFNTSPLPIVNIFSYTPRLKLILRLPIDDKTTTSNPDFSDIIPQLQQNLSFGRIDWIQNFRQGLLLNLDATVSYRTSYDGLDADFALTVLTHLTYNQIFGFNFRAYLFQQLYYRPSFEESLLDEGNDSAGELLRGIIDNEFENAINGVIFNADFMFNLFSIRPLLVDEVHAGVFSDFGIRTRQNTPFQIEHDLALTIGVASIVYTVFRSLHIRISYGIDLLELIEAGSYTFENREIFIGLSLFY